MCRLKYSMKTICQPALSRIILATELSAEETSREIIWVPEKLLLNFLGCKSQTLPMTFLVDSNWIVGISQLPLRLKCFHPKSNDRKEEGMIAKKELAQKRLTLLRVAVKVGPGTGQRASWYRHLLYAESVGAACGVS